MRIGTPCPKCTGSMILEQERLTKLVDKVCLNCGFRVYEEEPLLVKSLYARQPRFATKGAIND